MKVDGKGIAQNILENLKQRADALKKKGVISHLAIIFVGNDPASASYIKQKVKKAEEIGAKATVHHLPSAVSQHTLLRLLKELNNDKAVHGIIVQRPLPNHVDVAAIDEAVDPKKDVDGFHPKTTFQMPLGLAVLRILQDIFTRLNLNKGSIFIQWLSSQNIVIIGKGETGGGPVIKRLRELGVEPLIVDSKTQQPEDITKQADIIISTVGKPNVLGADMVKRGVAIVGVGMYRGDDGKMHGDYDEEKVSNVAAFYTPIPGGVGPVNVAMLLANLVTAAKRFQNELDKQLQ